MIPVLRPSFLGEEAEAVAAVLQSGWWGEGPRVAEFEHKLAERYGRKHCIAVNSCTAALHLAVLAHGIGPGDEVILPALTFVSTGLAVLYAGATPIFADVRPDSLTIDWQDASRLITSRTKAVIPVDYAGYPAKEANRFRWDDPYFNHEGYQLHPGFHTIQDAAHHCGGYGYGDTICLSFHPVKNLASPDGGAILTDGDAMDERLRALRWCGIDRSTWQRSGKRYSWDYAIAEVGYKCHWNDVAAAIGLVQLAYLAEMNAKRRKAAFYYGSNLGWVDAPIDHPYHTWHLYTIRVPAELRDGLIDDLADRGISAGVHYKPLTTYPMFAQATPPITDREWHRLVSLPLYADITREEQDRVIEAVNGYMAEHQ